MQNNLDKSNLPSSTSSNPKTKEEEELVQTLKTLQKQLKGKGLSKSLTKS